MNIPYFSSKCSTCERHLGHGFRGQNILAIWAIVLQAYFTALLVLAGIDLSFLIVAFMALSFGFVTKTTKECSSYC